MWHSLWASGGGDPARAHARSPLRPARCMCEGKLRAPTAIASSAELTLVPRKPVHGCKARGTLRRGWGGGKGGLDAVDGQ